jgi:hypothetical protein
MQANLYLDNVYQESSSITNYYCDASKLSTVDANKQCENYGTSRGILIYPNGARWISSIQSGNSCIATAQAHFYSISTIYSCTGTNLGSPNGSCPNKKVTSGPMGTIGIVDLVLGSELWEPNSPIKLNEMQCTSSVYGYYGSITPGNKYWCRNKVVNAVATQSTVDLGQVNCGTSNYPLLSSSTAIPAQHVYKALDFGKSSISGERIQIKSNAPSGATVKTSTLMVNQAGLQAGLITPISHLINSGSICSQSQLGKIVQDMSSTIIISQLQCTYNPTFCAGGGYCFLPVKNNTFNYKFAVPTNKYECPIGTVVDSNQPIDGISRSVSCPSNLGWILTQGLHGEGANCYISITGLKFCQAYQSVCNYTHGQVLVAGLKELRCTNTTTSYTVDNYTPEI